MMKDKEGGLSPSEPIENSGEFTTGSFTPHPRGSGLSEEKRIEEIRKDIFAAFGGYAKWEEDWKSLAEAVYNAGYRKQSEWISVEERLPDEQGRFLIVDKEGQMNTAFYTPRFGWFSHFRIKNITHWMPLPEAPKGGAE